MKTSELVKLLLDADPKGECVVCINNHPVSYVDPMPYYYDGRLEHIERDANGNVTKVGYKSGGSKIKIHYETVEDVLMDYPNAEFELSGVTYNSEISERHLESLEEWKRDGLEYQRWCNAYDLAIKTKQPLPDIIMTSEPESLQHKMHKWLQSLEIVK